MIQTIFKDIPFLKDAKSIEKIAKGFSYDEKYVIEMENSAQRYMLRLFSINQYDSKLAEFQVLQTVQHYTTKAIYPFEIGKLHEKAYMITSFIEGVDMEEGLKDLDEDAQYAIGFAAGEELLKIHEINAPSNLADWYDRKRKKHEKYVKAYQQCGFKIAHDEEILQFINNHLSFMEDRPNMLQHDDYHPVNLILHNGAFQGIIDFERFDWGDPIHDFIKVGMFTRSISTPFAVGQIRGYHQGNHPTEQFWTLYSLYLAMSIISSVVWTLKVAPSNMDFVEKQVELILADHELFQKVKPSWYK